MAEDVGLAGVTRAALGKAGAISFFGAMLGFIYVVWLQLAFLLFMLFQRYLVGGLAAGSVKS